ncbi:hypothetical protein A2Z33_02965 [Candidatus Gottesmanbacteria bacterium RBG_16_52_11]|uniref:Glycosyltransferase 2-like domain-containing protein n=1 Tax=Candidatus Gottesmanbacteria bacterium RBG_16_52_11 TaxID=1798374 RepID=A0A1F5YMB7_9BACT|nr:MAG: hypothetical protein A2Z33_02965 [Candidatus Gottesmanbacteria bacterium RBG_16_52_11]
MSRKFNLSAVVIARNEARRIGGCLRRLSFADEMIVLDNGSADRTAVIAGKSGARVILHPSGDFSDLRNVALAACRGNWVLYVDADEEVTDSLRDEIIKVTTDSSNPIAAYALKRRNYYLGHLWPKEESILRLFRKDALAGWYGPVHESAKVTGSTSQLNSPLIHRTHRNLSDMVQKTNRWSEIEAELRFAAGHPRVSWWRIFRVMATGFWDYFVRQGGYRAGATGLIESIYQAFSYFITYAKLWEKQQAKTG